MISITSYGRLLFGIIIIIRKSCLVTCTRKKFSLRFIIIIITKKFTGNKAQRIRSIFCNVYFVIRIM